MALDSRFPKSWCSRVESPNTGTKGPGFKETLTPAVVADVWAAWTDSSANWRRSSSLKATRSPWPPPGSAKRSSATRCSWAELRSMVRSIRIWSSLSSGTPSSRSSTKPRMEVIGVRSSWETVATTSSFIWVSSRRRLFCSTSDCVTSRCTE